MSEPPAIGTRKEEPYAAIHTAVTMDGFDVVEGLTDEVFSWLLRRGLVPSGPPFVRILTSDMSAELDIEVGLPVDEPITDDGRIIAGSIPEGAYVTLVYSANDQNDHLHANVALQAWAADRALEWQMDRSSGVEVWGGRFEFFHAEESSEGNHIFELTYQITDDSAATAHD
ncbi:MAG TPA: hypothetical protein VGG17_08880 [Acidimicrobiales bacterium]